MHVFYVILRYSTHRSMSKQLSCGWIMVYSFLILHIFKTRIESGLLHLLRRLGTGLFGNSSFNCIFG
ncbi:unnamed protein product [Rhizophagus irregularis]|nr:unnamed protein product [Rhizophagus irregularis]